MNPTTNHATVVLPDPASLGEGALPKGTRLHNATFEITELLGQGEHGFVYRGQDTSLQRAVAIKEFFPTGSVRQAAQVVPPRTLSGAEFNAARQSFGREASVLARFNDPAIVRIFRVFEENNTAYMVMEFLEGQTLQNQLLGGALSIGNVLAVGTRIGEALATVHDARLLHQDVQPKNIFLARDGRVVLIGFGTAREYSDAARALTAPVTHDYAALEQYGHREQVGPPTDIYGLGATLYHALTGHAPTSPPDRLAGRELPTPDQRNRHIAPAIGRVVMHALQIQPAARPQTAREFLGEWQQAQANAVPVVPPPPSTPPPPRRAPRTPAAPPRSSTPTIPAPAAPTPAPPAAPTPASAPTPALPSSTPVPVPGTMLCPYCQNPMPVAMSRCPHCRRARSTGLLPEESMVFREWYRNENTRVGIGWALAAVAVLLVLITLWRGLIAIGLKPQRIKSEDVRATHARSVEDAQQFQSRSEFDASPACMRDTGPNYPCSDDNKYIAAVNMAAGDDVLEVTVSDEWKQLDYQRRLDYAQAMLNRWIKIHAPLQAKLRLLDRDGNEVGGRALSGNAWVSS